MASVAAVPTSPDVRLTVQSGKLVMNGVEADDIAVDLISGATGLDLRTVQIGSVEGARLDASGLVIDNSQGSDGSVGVEVTRRRSARAAAAAGHFAEGRRTRVGRGPSARPK